MNRDEADRALGAAVRKYIEERVLCVPRARTEQELWDAVEAYRKAKESKR